MQQRQSACRRWLRRDQAANDLANTEAELRMARAQGGARAAEVAQAAADLEARGAELAAARAELAGAAERHLAAEAKVVRLGEELGRAAEEIARLEGEVRGTGSWASGVACRLDAWQQSKCKWRLTEDMHGGAGAWRVCAGAVRQAAGAAQRGGARLGQHGGGQVSAAPVAVMLYLASWCGQKRLCVRLHQGTGTAGHWWARVTKCPAALAG